MSLHIITCIVYIISVFLAMIALSCFRFELAIKKSKTKEFYMFYIMASIALGYLFARFILDFGTMSLF